jgi:hypothetical protein
MIIVMRLTLLAALVPAMVTAQIEIRVQADPPGDDERNLNGEYVLVSNDRTTPLDLSGWRLCNAVAHCYVFPDSARIGPRGDLRVHTGSGTNTLQALYMGRDRPLWANWADVATLTDRAGAVQARCLWDRGRRIDCSPP